MFHFEYLRVTPIPIDIQSMYDSERKNRKRVFDTIDYVFYFFEK